MKRTFLLAWALGAPFSVAAPDAGPDGTSPAPAAGLRGEGASASPLPGTGSPVPAAGLRGEAASAAQLPGTGSPVPAAGLRGEAASAARLSGTGSPVPAAGLRGEAASAARLSGTVRQRRAAAEALYDAKDFAGCTAAFEALAVAPPWSRPAEALYSAACCAALAGQPARAFALLDRVVDSDLPRTAKSAEQDPDLASLRADPAGWARFRAALSKALQKDALEPRLQALVDADQAERGGPMKPGAIERDRARRRTLDALLAKGVAKSVRDWLAAALLYQHGDGAADIARANELANKALQLGPGRCDAQHMVAITEDRLLERQGKLQKYGTQYGCPDGKRCVRNPVDAAVTDEQRTALCVEPLAEQVDTMDL